MPDPKPIRIVLTGGPGGGKTTAADLFRREIGSQVVVVPEAASMLFNGGFPRTQTAEAQRATQRAIYDLQTSLEAFHRAQYPGRLLICDRGALDGAAYWPNQGQDFFRTMHTSYERELSRYDAVLFFESAAVGGLRIEGGNPARIESNAEAVEIDRRLRAIWSKHPRFVVIQHNESFFKKISFALAAIESLVAQLSHRDVKVTRGERRLRARRLRAHRPPTTA